MFGFFIVLFSFFVLAFFDSPVLRNHFWLFTDVQNGNQRVVTRKVIGSRASYERTSSLKVQATHLPPQLLLQRNRLGCGDYDSDETRVTAADRYRV